MEEQKDISRNITNQPYEGATEARIALYDEEMNIQDPYDDEQYPQMKIIVGETERKFKEGVITLEIKQNEFDHYPIKACFNADLLIGVSQYSYARSTTDLEERMALRKKAIRYKKNFRYIIREIKHFFVEWFDRMFFR